MYIFFGLGNFGEKYIHTPHNAGFMIVEYLYDAYGRDQSFKVSDWSYDKYLMADIATARKGGEDMILFVKPRTMMNLSGQSVHAITKKFKPQVGRDLILLHDDLDLELGTYKVQRGVGPKSHNGVNSVIRHLGLVDFIRVRIGVEARGDLKEKIAGEDYVLMPYSEDEMISLNEAIVSASSLLRKTVHI